MYTIYVPNFLFKNFRDIRRSFFNTNLISAKQFITPYIIINHNYAKILFRPYYYKTKKIPLNDHNFSRGALNRISGSSFCIKQASRVIFYSKFWPKSHTREYQLLRSRVVTRPDAEVLPLFLSFFSHPVFLLPITKPPSPLTGRSEIDNRQHRPKIVSPASFSIKAPWVRLNYSWGHGSAPRYTAPPPKEIYKCI